MSRMNNSIFQAPLRDFWARALDSQGHHMEIIKTERQIHRGVPPWWAHKSTPSMPKSCPAIDSKSKTLHFKTKCKWWVWIKWWRTCLLIIQICQRKNKLGNYRCRISRFSSNTNSCWLNSNSSNKCNPNNTLQIFKPQQCKCLHRWWGLLEWCLSRVITHSKVPSNNIPCHSLM